MNVDRYLFQSPYSSQVQIGRPDPAIVQKEDVAATEGDSFTANKTATNPLQAQTSSESSSSTETTTTPSVDTGSKLDIYA